MSWESDGTKEADLSKKIESLYNDEEWNCGLLSVADALSMMGVDITYKQLLSRYIGQGFKIYNFGISSVHVALLVKTFNFNVILKTHSNWLRELWNYRKNNLISRMNSSEESKDTLRAMEMLINFGGKIYFYTKKTYPNIKNVILTLTKGSLIILCVNAKRYYCINENWNHYLVITLDMTANPPFKIKDPLENIGKRYYSKWDAYLRHAKEYKWSTWSGDMIVISR